MDDDEERHGHHDGGEHGTDRPAPPLDVDVDQQLRHLLRFSTDSTEPLQSTADASALLFPSEFGHSASGVY